MDSAVEREQTGAEAGLILDIGPDAWYDKPSKWAQPGYRITFAKYAGKQLDGEEYGFPDYKLRIINDEDVLGIIHNDAEMREFPMP